MDFSLSDNDQRLVERAEELAIAFAPRARAYDEAAAFPEEDFARLRDEGFLTLTVPEELGGHGMWSGKRYAAYYTILAAIAAGNASTAQLLQIQSHASGIVAYLGNDEQKRRILGDVVTRGALIASCGSEADPRQMNASTRRAELVAPETRGSSVGTSLYAIVSVPPVTGDPSALPSTTTGVPWTEGFAVPPVAGALGAVVPVELLAGFGVSVAPLPPPHAARIAVISSSGRAAEHSTP